MHDRAAPPVSDLVARARRGDARAFEALVAGHERLALGVAYAALQDAPQAADVVQESFVKAWRSLGDLADPAAFAPWLCHIVRNGAADVRRRKRLATCDLGHASGRPDPRAAAPGDSLDRRERSDRVAAALATLDELTRSAMVLRYYENRTSREIAELLGTTAPAIDMRLMRGRALLKERLAMEATR